MHCWLRGWTANNRERTARRMSRGLHGASRAWKSFITLERLLANKTRQECCLKSEIDQPKRVRCLKIRVLKTRGGEQCGHSGGHGKCQPWPVRGFTVLSPKHLFMSGFADRKQTGYDYTSIESASPDKIKLCRYPEKWCERVFVIVRDRYVLYAGTSFHYILNSILYLYLPTWTILWMTYCPVPLQ